MNTAERKQIAGFLASLRKPWEASSARAPAGLMDGVAVTGASRPAIGPLDPWLPKPRQSGGSASGVVFVQRDTSGHWRAVFLGEHLDPPAVGVEGRAGPGWYATPWEKTRGQALGFLRRRGIRT